MKKEVYYRYKYGDKSVFSKIIELENKETEKRAGKKWAKEVSHLARKINKSISWLHEPDAEKEVKFFYDILRTLKVCPSGKSPSASAVSI